MYTEVAPAVARYYGRMCSRYVWRVSVRGAVRGGRWAQIAALDIGVV